MQHKLDARHSLIHQYGVPEGWQDVSLGAIADVVGGGTPSRDEGRYWQDGNIPWATPTDLTALNTKYLSTTAERITAAGLSESAATKLPVGTVLYTSRATIGAKAIAAIEIATSRFASFVPRGVNGEFLYYLLDLVTPVIKRLGAGTTFDEVSKRDIRKVHCAIPSDPNEQAAIARVLDAVDAAIGHAREALSRAQEAGRALIADAFDRMDGQTRKLGEFSTDVRYGTSQASSERRWGNPVLRIPNVIGDQLTLDDLAYVDLRPVDVDRLALSDGDLLLVRTNGNPNYVGRSAVFRRPDGRVWVYASYLIRVRLSGELLPDYVNVFLSSERGRRELLRRVTTSAGNHNINSS